MPPLRELQRGFLSSMVSGDERIHTAITATGGLMARERFAIYRNNHLSSLESALAAVYSAIKRLLGEDCFRQTARAYSVRHPSRSGNLHDFGCHLPEFLSSARELAELPYLPDVARIEWGWHRAFHACDMPPFPLDRLATISTADHERLRFTVGPSVTLIPSPYPVVTIWNANQTRSDAVPVVDLAEGHEAAAVLRSNGRVHVRALEAGASVLLQALLRGSRLAGAIAEAHGADPDFDSVTTLRDFLGTEMLVDFHL